MVNSQKDCWIRKLAYMQFCLMLPNPPSEGLYRFSFPSAACEHGWFSRASPQKCAKIGFHMDRACMGGRDRYIHATAPRTHHLSTAPQLTPGAGGRHVFPTAQPPGSSYSLSSTQQPVILQKDHSLFLTLQQLPRPLRTKPRQLPQPLNAKSLGSGFISCHSPLHSRCPSLTGILCACLHVPRTSAFGVPSPQDARPQIPTRPLPHFLQNCSCLTLGDPRFP